MERSISLEPFDPELHSGILLDWLCRPHVKRWWGDPQPALDHARRSLPDTHALIVADGEPVGYLCWQRPTEGEREIAELTDLPEELVDIDILIGEPELLGQGIGSRALRLLLDRLRRDSSVLFAGLAASMVNAHAGRAYQRAGFRPYREFQDPEWGRCQYFIVEVHSTV